MAQQSLNDCIRTTTRSFYPYYQCEYTNSHFVKEGLKRLLSDRYRNNFGNFTDHFVHPTLSLLSRLKDENFPLCLRNGKVVLHLVPPQHIRMTVGEFFYQVGHTNPGSLVVKFAKYEDKGRTVNELQRATVREEDYDIAFTKEYFDQARSAAVTLGDVLMRTIIVANHPDWSTEKEDAVNHLQKCPEHRHGRLRSESHLSVEESCDDKSITSEQVEPHSPHENNDSCSSIDDVLMRQISSSSG